MTDPDPIQLAYSGPQLIGMGKRARRRAGRRVYGPVGETVRLGLSAGAWAAVAWLVLVLPLVLVAFLFGPLLGFPGLVFMVLFLALMGVAARSVRLRRANSVLGYLDQAVRLNQPLDRLLAAAARSERGRLRTRLEDLCLAVQGGMSLADAVSAAVPEMPGRAVGQIACAESTGQLGPCLRRLLREGKRASGERSDDRAFAAWYPPLVLTAVAAMVGLLATFVLPKYMQIFHDFRAPLPLVTRWFAEWGEWSVYVGLLMLVGVLIAVGLQLRSAMRGEGPSWLVRGMTDRVLWGLPYFGRPHRDQSAADLSDALADALGQGFPLDVAAERAKHLDLSSVLRRRAALWFGAMRQGMDPVEAARRYRLPRLMTGLLATAPPGEATVAALRFAGRFYAGRAAARRGTMAAAYVPLVTLFLGVVVGTVALALFLPIRDLIERVAPYKGGL